jgi:hypothetical protein
MAQVMKPSIGREPNKKKKETQERKKENFMRNLRSHIISTKDKPVQRNLNQNEDN